MKNAPEIAQIKKLLDDLLIEMARTRTYIRESLPECADVAYGMAQKDPMKLSNYAKYAFLEAKKRGLIAPDSPDLSQEE